MKAAPVGRGIAAVDRLRIIEPGIADRHELRMEIGDLALVIGKECVVRTVRLALGDFEEFGEVAGLGAQIALFECGDGAVHQGKGNPFLAHDRAVVAGPCGETAARHGSVGAAIAQRDRVFRKRADLPAIAIAFGPGRGVDDGFGKLVDVVDPARRVHPSGMGVEPLIDEELPPRDRAIGIEAFAAGHLQFGAEEEAGMRIDQQQRMAVLRP
jgi:hypothetical protein